MEQKGKDLGVKLKKFDARQFLQGHGIIIGFIAIVGLLSIARPNFLSIGNIVTMLRQVSGIGIATIGIGFLIIMSCNDLGLGSVLALVGILSGLTVSTGAFGLALPTGVGFLVGIAASTMVALFAGTIIAKARIPAFIVTMGTMSICRGLALIFAHGMPVANFPAAFTYLGTANLGPIPWSVIMYIMVIGVAWYILNKRPFGRYIYAVGSNEEAARVAGINVDRVKILAYLFEGITLGIAGILYAGRLKSASPTFATGYELDAIAGCIIGGVSFSGGIGTVSDMVIGALLLGVINNGMDLLGVEAFYKQVVKGAIIIIAVLIDRKRTGRS
ncbi:ABC transporter permease [Parasphaerochaeta coccoides]|uniref:Inner-membrane translocator n=1 Tax=Parasphaerochaeta coccoides (strain ATCC BAA-1237 / DSM 17374 / SPN1) TaxID=760011 RepID=F4GJJ3_PARC1|nr:ABC transporter permease [Parasphaerochaeta coccoides]AEC02258.1 inner-membrane translocator [Parasphaerochaeta coccoides DSM 17374]